jgi:hypothetical protein
MVSKLLRGKYPRILPFIMELPITPWAFAIDTESPNTSGNMPHRKVKLRFST